MVEESRLDVLQDEIKLLKAEVKNSLASVRDYLLNMELPSSEFSTILAALSGDNTEPQKLDVDNHVSGDKVGEMPQPDIFGDKPDVAEQSLNDEPEQPGEYEDMLDFEESEAGEATPEEKPDDGAIFDEDSPINTLPEVEEPTDEYTDEEEPDVEDLLPEDELEEPEPENETDDENEETNDEESVLPAEEVQPMDSDHYMNEVNRGIPKVNMLANLINWVAKARQEIGDEELPTFLEVYGTTGHLSPELKEVIIHLAEIVKEHSEVASESQIWSQSMLSLHGILTGGDAPLNPVIPSWVDETEPLTEDEIIEVDKTKGKQAKLKLVLPNADGESKEFCINLTPEEDDDD